MSAIFILNRFLKESIIILLFFRFFLISHDASSPRTILFLVYNIAPQCSTFILSFPPQMGYNVHVSKEPCRNTRDQQGLLADTAGILYFYRANARERETSVSSSHGSLRGLVFLRANARERETSVSSSHGSLRRLVFLRDECP